MILILIALIVSAVATWLLFWHANNNYKWTGTFAAIIGAFLASSTAIVGIFYVSLGWSWFASESKAQIINREYGTNYTQKEIFFASSVIDTIRDIDHKRVEINGDVMCDTPNGKR